MIFFSSAAYTALPLIIRTNYNISEDKWIEDAGEYK
jgi:hypothetical protein